MRNLIVELLDLFGMETRSNPKICKWFGHEFGTATYRDNIGNIKHQCLRCNEWIKYGG